MYKTRRERFFEKVEKMSKKQMIELITKCVIFNGGKVNNYMRESIWTWGDDNCRVCWHGHNGTLLTSLKKAEVQRIAEMFNDYVYDKEINDYVFHS